MKTSQAQSKISNAVASYLELGGQITKVPGFAFKPLPPRVVPKPVLIAALENQNDAVKEPLVHCVPDDVSKKGGGPVIEGGQVKRIAALAAAGLSVIQISNRTSIPRNVIRDLAKQLEFKVSERAVR